MDENRLLTAGDVAAHCHVTHKSVSNWIRSGRLKAYTTPGRHYRIRLLEFREFLKQTGLPPLPEEALSPSGKTRVLVVDDDEDVVKTVSAFFTRWGYEVSTALSGFNAGLEVERFKPDLVVLDLMMPHVDGYDVCRTIKSDPTTRHIKVLVLTGYTEKDCIEKALESGADDWMAKPFRAEAFKSRIAKLLGERSNRGA